jgi:hypothetical protein
VLDAARRDAGLAGPQEAAPAVVRVASARAETQAGTAEGQVSAWVDLRVVPAQPAEPLAEARHSRRTPSAIPSRDADASGSNICSMPNETPESVLLVAIKSLVGLLAPSERSRLQTWILARFDVSGYPHRTFEDRGR